jgi:para-aminobenzoate synthetase component 1
VQLNREEFNRVKQQIEEESHLNDVCLILDNNFVANACGIRHLEWAAARGVRHHLTFEPNMAFDALRAFTDAHAGEYIFGFLAYDLKNETEALVSEHPDGIGFETMAFFVPERLIVIDPDLNVVVGEAELKELLSREVSAPVEVSTGAITMQQRVSREAYLQQVQRIKAHIVEGDVYELNYCVEFYNENTEADPLTLYRRLKDFSPTPFGAFLKWINRYLICASPERFMTALNGRYFSQPIKGTIRRDEDEATDQRLKDELQQSEKERAENLMIVDLVRNDLARSSQTGSVDVDELFGIYTFRNLHQMISTVSSVPDPKVHRVDAIRHAFPMGSMTGAPKIKAMELIEQYEQTRRGMYSGTVGYFAPDGSFDFNVVIRSMQYNATSNYLCFEVGSAITYDSDAAQEYDECMLKARAIMSVLHGG